MIFGGFAGEANDDVGADGGVRERFADEFDSAGVMGGAIPAMHGAKNAIGAALQRQMKMRGDARLARDEIDEILSDVDRFDGTEAKAGKRAFVKDFADEGEKREARREVAAVTAEIDSAEDDFLRAGFDEMADFIEHSGGLHAAAASANKRNHAVGAAMIASVLDFESGASARGGEIIVTQIGTRVVRRIIRMIRRSDGRDVRGHFLAEDAR